jgi:hypothetical protein
MRRNRTQAAWPDSSYDRAAGDPLERRFLPTSDEILGIVRHGTGDACDRLRIDSPGPAGPRRDGSAEQNW